MTDWLAEGLPGRTAKTVEVNRDSLRPLLDVIGAIPLRDLTVQDMRAALKKMAGTHATRTLQKAHNCLTRAVRHAEGQDWSGGTCRLWWTLRVGWRGDGLSR